MYKTVMVLCLISFFCFVAGCGGGGSSPRPTPTPTPTPAPLVTPHLVIGWGARSRAIGNLNSALSAVVRLSGAKTDGSDLVFVHNRAATLGAYSETVTASEAARTGSWPLTVSFFADTNGAGSLVGTAQATVSLAADGALPDIAVTGVIQKIEITAGQQILVGETRDLLFSARTASDTLIPITPGSVFFTVNSGTDRLQIVGGQVQGVLPGNATVTAQVDGISSAAASVHIGSNAVVTISPNPVAILTNASVTLTAQVSGTANQAVNWSVQEGAAGGSIDAGGHYTAPATAGVYHVQAMSQYDPDKSAVVAVTVASPPVETVVYNNDFEGAVGSEWSSTITDTTPVGARRFLGLFASNESVTLSLNSLPSHQNIRIAFDLFVVRTWDGNDTQYGPDVWRLTCDSATLLNTTFSNWDKGLFVFRQAYPGSVGTGDFPPRTGASENNTLGFLTGLSIYPGNIQDSVYHLTYTVPHQAGTAQFSFIGAGKYDGSLNDEGWGVDNVKVTVY